MTTATDWGVTWTDTGSHAVVTGVDVTSAATPDAPVRVGGWTPNPNHYIPEHVAALLAPIARTMPALSWARMSGVRSWPQIPDEALTAYGRAEQEYRDAHQQIQDLRDLAFWVEQEQRKIVSEISDEYWSRRSAMQLRYEQEIARLHNEDDDATYAAYVSALPGYVRGVTATVATEQHTSVYSELAPDRIHADVPPDNRVDRMVEDPERYFAEAREHAEREVRAEMGDRSGLDKLRDRVPTALTTGEQPALEPEPEPPRVGGWRVWAASAAIGIVGLAATIGALVVWA